MARKGFVSDVGTLSVVGKAAPAASGKQIPAAHSHAFFCAGMFVVGNAERIQLDVGGRSGEIRTPDPLVPNQMRYQTALHSVADG
jgi:hypothetical protein